ncbi:MAG TPA: BatD family protein [Oligoflexus sp.]|uniref:BatD family protein n=1 Tax=Oligoflexus sp. TaxID=1971216 RepID=UPI002D80207C|nr:BatD family protein [Oligoflexus sp.]HET9235879.1 BatD family protein [Oligoflexus sp.]
MARIGKLAGIFISFWCFASAALAGMITGELDKPEGSVEDQFVYTLAVQGSADGEPAFPEVPGLSIRQAGTSQSVSIINGRMSREVQYQFVIIPDKAGSYTIPPIVMTVDGKKEQTLPIEFRVTAAGTSPQGQADRPLFLERVVAKDKVYVGEAVPSSIRVYSRVRILGAQPDFRYPDGFQVKKIDGEKNYSKLVDGQAFNVTEINAILIPTKEGRFEIPAAGLDVRFVDTSKPRRTPRSLLEDFWGQGNTVEKHFRSGSASIEVLPLPVAGRRSDFSGLVGEFQGRAEIASRAVKVGETVTLTLTIEGRGATSGMADPELGLGDRAKVYKDKPQSDDTFDAQEGVLGQRLIKMAIVPSVPGDLALGTLKIQYFNTAVGQYQDMTIDLGHLQVTGSPAAAAAPPAASPQPQAAETRPSTPSSNAPAEVKSLARDLLEPHPPERLRTHETVQTLDVIAAAVMLVGSLGFLGWGARRAWIRRQGGQHEQRKKADRALRAASRQLLEARQLLDQKDIQAAVGLAQSSIRQYMSDKFNIKGSALTLRDLEQQLVQHGLSGPTLTEMRQVWQNLDQLRFAAASADQDQGREALQKVNQLLTEVEQRCAH